MIKLKLKNETVFYTQECYTHPNWFTTQYKIVFAHDDKKVFVYEVKFENCHEKELILCITFEEFNNLSIFKIYYHIFKSYVTTIICNRENIEYAEIFVSEFLKYIRENFKEYNIPENSFYSYDKMEEENNEEFENKTND